jgi:hypothetical protein
MTLEWLVAGTHGMRDLQVQRHIFGAVIRRSWQVGVTKTGGRRIVGLSKYVTGSQPWSD